MINEGLFSSDSDEWETPQSVFDALDKEFGFTLDPCATDENHKCKTYFTKEIDGLKQKWSGTVFMNPPYGRKIGIWIEKAFKESELDVTVVCLLPARTDTKWFHKFCMKGEIRFIKGRLHFGNSKQGAPFPSMIVVFNGTNKQHTIESFQLPHLPK